MINRIRSDVIYHSGLPTPDRRWRSYDRRARFSVLENGHKREENSGRGARDEKLGGERGSCTFASMIRNDGAAISIPERGARTPHRSKLLIRAPGPMKNGNRSITIPGGPVGPVRIAPVTTFHSPPDATIH